MLKKRAVVQANPELNSMLSNAEISEGDVLFRSDEYIQIGCDLRNLAALNSILSASVDIGNCEFCSIEHMNCLRRFVGQVFLIS